MATVTRSLDPLAQASANAITFKQLNLEQAPAIRPEVIAVIGQPATSKESSLTENVPVLSDGTFEEAFALFGASPLYYAATKLFPKNGNGARCPVYYLPCFPDTGTAAQFASNSGVTGTATSSFTAQLTFRELPFAAAADACGKIATNALTNPARSPRNIKLDGFTTFSIRFTVTKGMTFEDVLNAAKAAVDAEFEAPFTATVTATPELELDLLWAGASANDMAVTLTDLDGVTLDNYGYSAAVTFSLATSGAGTFDIETALDNLTDQFGITRVVNQFDDTTNMDFAQVWGEGKRDSLIAQYAMVYSGREYPESGSVAGTVDVAAVKALGDARKDDAVNSWIYGTYGDLRELSYAQRDTLLKAGVSNIQIKGGTPTLMDSVTLYHPDGVQNPIFKYDDSICKEGNIAYDLQIYLESEEWDSKILVSKGSQAENPDAVDIDDYAAAINGRAELWEKSALIASATFTKANSTYTIDDLSPRRVNANIKTQLTSGLAITDHTLFTGFLFGESA